MNRSIFHFANACLASFLEAFPNTIKAEFDLIIIRWYFAVPLFACNRNFTLDVVDRLYFARSRLENQIKFPKIYISVHGARFAKPTYVRGEEKARAKKSFSKPETKSIYHQKGTAITKILPT